MSKEHQDVRPTLCVGILTLNEARNISRCIKSAQFADQLLVVDSGSTDKTCEIARTHGAEVVIYDDWQGFAIQRDRLLNHCKSDYIFFLDADEEITENLQQEIINAVQSNNDHIYEVLWDEVAYGRQLKYMDTTKGIPRLFKASSIDHFDGVVHEGAIMKPGQRKVLKFKERLRHYSRVSIHDSILKLAQYSQHGAVKRLGRKNKGGIWRGIASGFAIFIRLYFFRKGFLCGPQGFLVCFFIALECFFRYVLLKYDTPSPNALAKRY